MNAEVLVIGDEILIGQTIDTNSGWIAARLTEHNIQTRSIRVLPDGEEQILQALEAASKRSDLVLLTGGLGPTRDDVTKQTLSRFFQSPLKMDDLVLQHIERIFERSGRPLLPVNIQQAEVLELSEVLFNEAGTAPGMWIEYHDTIFVVMPGVPSEMKYLMDHEVIPRLRQRRPSGRMLRHAHLLTSGIGESFLAELIKPIELGLPDYIHLAYLPSFSQVRLRLSAEGVNQALLDEELDIYVQRMKEVIGVHVVNEDRRSLEETVLDEMRSSGLRLAVAESCSGGMLSHLLTRIPGSSEVFLGGVIAYSNDLKVRFLDVSRETLQREGAVSEQTALEMARGARRATGSDYAIAITGVAGPGGGSDEKPVGTVWIGIAGPNTSYAQLFRLGKRREDTIHRSSRQALFQLLKTIRAENQEKLK